MSGSQLSGTGPVPGTDEGTRRCALPGCDVEIGSVHGRPERRYCSATHRAAARQVRRAADRDRAAAAAGDEVTGILPWLAVPPGPVASGPDGSGPDGSGPDASGAVPSGPVPVDIPTGPVLRPVARPAAASRTPGGEPGAVARAAAQRSRDNRRSGSGGRHALVVIGVAGLVAGGYAATVGADAPVTPAPVQLAPPGAVPSPDAWAERATLALVGVNRQLDTLARAEEQWEQLPTTRGRDVPAPLVALAQRRAELQQRRSTLQAQLDDHRSLRTAQDDLRASEQRLRDLEQAVEQALAHAPSRAPAAEQEAAAVALAEQRDLTLRRRDARRAQLRGLEDRVSAAARAPLPDDAATTAKVSADVLEVVRAGGVVPDAAAAPPGGGVSGPPRGATTAPRGEESEPGTRTRPTPTTRPTTEPTTRPTSGRMSERDRDPSGPPTTSPRRDAGTQRPGTTAQRTPAGSTRLASVPAGPVRPGPVPPGSVPTGSVLPGSTLLVESDGDTVALLHEHARRVAREARRAAGAAGAAGAAHAPEGAPAPAPTGAGRPRPAEAAVASPVAGRAAPSGVVPTEPSEVVLAAPSGAVLAAPSEVVPAAPPGLVPVAPSGAIVVAPSPGPVTAGSVDRDDDTIEELNEARWTALRAGPWRHRPSA